MSIPGSDDPKKAPKAKNNICIVSNHNRKLGWRILEGFKTIAYAGLLFVV